MDGERGYVLDLNNVEIQGGTNFYYQGIQVSIEFC